MRRPKTRGDCEFIPRPCPFVSCKYNLYLDVNPRTGKATINHPDIEPEDMGRECSCALDVADWAAATGDPTMGGDIAQMLGIEQASVFNIIKHALKKMKNSIGL